LEVQYRYLQEPKSKRTTSHNNKYLQRNKLVALKYSSAKIKMCIIENDVVLGTNYNTLAKKFKISREANSSKFPVTIKQISQKELATKAITPKICMT